MRSLPRGDTRPPSPIWGQRQDKRSVKKEKTSTGQIGRGIDVHTQKEQSNSRQQDLEGQKKREDLVKETGPNWAQATKELMTARESKGITGEKKKR